MPWPFGRQNPTEELLYTVNEEPALDIWATEARATALRSLGYVCWACLSGGLASQIRRAGFEYSRISICILKPELYIYSFVKIKT